MKGSTFLNDNMAIARIEKSQLITKLRQASVTLLDQMLALVLEATGRYFSFT